MLADAKGLTTRPVRYWVQVRVLSVLADTFLGSSAGMNGWLLTIMSQVRVLSEEPKQNRWKAYTTRRDPAKQMGKPDDSGWLRVVKTASWCNG